MAEETHELEKTWGQKVEERLLALEDHLGFNKAPAEAEADTGTDADHTHGEEH